MSALESVLSKLDTDLDSSVKRLFDLLRIPSVSTDMAFDSDCRRAAEWLVHDLTGIGFEARACPTQGKPMVLARWTPPEGEPQTPHVLFYGHYDVQPPDPLDLWETGPFEPQLKSSEDGAKQIVARGASDDKGQVMTFIEACRAWMASTGRLPVGVTILLEGEEESGSPSLAPFLAAHKQELAADIVLVCDTSMWNAETPAITTRLRGMMIDEVKVTAANRDLHSGLYGGAARNPIHVLSRIIADIHDDQGHIQIPGFYDDVEEISDELKAQWQALGFDAKAFLGGVGLSIPAGEQDRLVLEQLWARPTCDVNGMHGGYTGEGSKTMIASWASAKVSFRLVSDQDPEKIREAFRAFVQQRLPGDCSVEFIAHGGSRAHTLDTSNMFCTKAMPVLEAEFGKPPAMVGVGGSIPIVGSFKRELGMDALMIGFALDDDAIHSPNEKYNLTSFHKGQRSWARILDAFAR